MLPLSLVEDIKSLSSASNVAIAIYTIFVLQVTMSINTEYIQLITYRKT